MQQSKPENLCMFVGSDNKSLIFPIQVVGPLGGKFDVYSASEFEIQSDFDY